MSKPPAPTDEKNYRARVQELLYPYPDSGDAANFDEASIQVGLSNKARQGSEEAEVLLAYFYDKFVNEKKINKK